MAKKIYVNGKEEQPKKKHRLPPEIDWEAEAHRVNRENDAKKVAGFTKEQKEKLKPNRGI